MKRFQLFTMVAMLLAGVTYMFLPVPVQAAWQTVLIDSGLATSGVGMAMIVNAQAVDDVFILIKTTFNKALEAVTGEWKDTASEISSTTAKNLYKWFGRFPKMRKWVGEKYIKSLEAYEYALKNEPWEATVEVDRDDIEDDETGQYTLQATDAGQSAGEWATDLVDMAKNAAFTELCFDGQPFYDTDHPVAGASVSNKLVVALSAANRAAADASYGAARLMMSGFKDEEGKPLKLVGNVLEVSSALEVVGKTLLEAEKLDDGSTNPYRGTAVLKVNPGLESTTAWMLHHTKKAIKPFIYQPRKSPVFVKMTNPESKNVFMNKTFYFGVEARGNAGYSFWQLSVGSTG